MFWGDGFRDLLLAILDNVSEDIWDTFSGHSGSRDHFDEVIAPVVPIKTPIDVILAQLGQNGSESLIENILGVWLLALETLVG